MCAQPVMLGKLFGVATLVIAVCMCSMSLTGLTDVVPSELAAATGGTCYDCEADYDPCDTGRSFCAGPTPGFPGDFTYIEYTGVGSHYSYVATSGGFQTVAFDNDTKGDCWIEWECPGECTSGSAENECIDVDYGEVDVWCKVQNPC